MEKNIIAKITVKSYKSMSKVQKKRFIAWLRENADWFENTKWNIADDFVCKLEPLSKK